MDNILIKNEQEDDDDSLFSVVTGSGIGPARKRAINSLEKAATASAVAAKLQLLKLLGEDKRGEFSASAKKDALQIDADVYSINILKS